MRSREREVGSTARRKDQASEGERKAAIARALGSLRGWGWMAKRAAKAGQPGKRVAAAPSREAARRRCWRRASSTAKMACFHRSCGLLSEERERRAAGAWGKRRGGGEAGARAEGSKAEARERRGPRCAGERRMSSPPTFRRRLGEGEGEGRDVKAEEEDDDDDDEKGGNRIARVRKEGGEAG